MVQLRKRPNNSVLRHFNLSKIQYGGTSKENWEKEPVERRKTEFDVLKDK
jgi:hypothetical protein